MATKSTEGAKGLDLFCVFCAFMANPVLLPWSIYLAFKQLFPSGWRLPFFTLISVLGVGLGVALMLVSTSVMGGFGHQIKAMIIDTQGEVQIRGRTALKATDALEKIIAGVPEVAAFGPYAQGVVMLEFEHRPAFPGVQGFDIARMKQVIPLERYIIEGSLDDLDDDSVILSSQLAYRARRARRGQGQRLLAAHVGADEAERGAAAARGARGGDFPHRPPATGQLDGHLLAAADAGPLRHG